MTDETAQDIIDAALYLTKENGYVLHKYGTEDLGQGWTRILLTIKPKPKEA